MGYEVKVADIRSVRKATSKQIDEWLSKIEAVGKACSGMIHTEGMQGATATSIRDYIGEIHVTLLASIAQMITEYKDRLYVYETGYDSIDGSAKAHMTQEILEEQSLKIESNKSDFLEVVNYLQQALDEVADIFAASPPSTRNICNSFDTIKNLTITLNDKVGSYEYDHETDCNGIREQISSIKSFMQALKNESKITIETYSAGEVLSNPYLQNLQNSYLSSTAYYEGNADEILKAREYIETKNAVAEARVEKGVWDIAAAVGVLAIGVAAIVITGGAATPLVAVAIGSTIAYGASNAVEGIQDIQYGLAGDVQTVAMNPIRDTVFLGNQTAYDTWGMISTGISLGAVCSPALASQQITVEGTKQAVANFLRSGVSNVAKQSITFAGKTAVVSGSGVVVEKVVAPHTSEDFGRLCGLLTGAYVGSKVFGVKKPKVVESEDVSNATYQSLLGDMSEADAIRYEKFLKEGSKAGLTDAELNGLLKVDEQLALNKVDYDEILKIRNQSNVSTISEGGLNSGDQFYKSGGGSNLDDYMTPHSEKHAFNPNVKSTKKATQFGENIDVAKLREDTMLNPDSIVYNTDQNVIIYKKEYDFNISTSDTPTGSHRVYINLDPKPGKTNRNSQFPYYGGDK